MSSDITPSFERPSILSDWKPPRTYMDRIFLKKPKIVTLAEEAAEKLERKLSLTDLLALGIGGTIGSGVFVLSGLIANKYAGPGVIFSYLIAGLGCFFSGLSYAEMASRIPSAGSSFAYSFYALGELPAVIAAFCLTLEYGLSGAAVARSWGDKLSDYLEDDANLDTSWLKPGYSINPLAGLMQIACVAITLGGVNMGKLTVNFFTILKLLLVAFMTITGYTVFNGNNLTPIAPKGMSGIFRGATSSFFAYLGYDEICTLAAEAKNPHRNLPISVMGSIAVVTFVYLASALSLVGMQYWKDIDQDSGFKDAFKANDLNWAGQITAIGEIVTLPLVVLVSFIAQPRIQFAMASDGLLPSIFSEVDKNGNLKKSILITGSICTLVALFVPFSYLDDMISVGVLLSFNLTNSSLVVIRRQNQSNPKLTLNYIIKINILLVISFALWINLPWSYYILFSLPTSIMVIYYIIKLSIDCPEIDDKNNIDNLMHIWKAPGMPFFPCIAMAFNYFLIFQLDPSALGLIVGYILLAILFYFSYGIKNSVGSKNGWRDLLIDTTFDDVDSLSSLRESLTRGETMNSFVRRRSLSSARNSSINSFRNSINSLNKDNINIQDENIENDDDHDSLLKPLIKKKYNNI